MDAADGCDLLGWHSSLAVMEDREEEDTDGLEPAVRLGHAGLDQQWGSQIGGRVHPVRFQQASGLHEGFAGLPQKPQISVVHFFRDCGQPPARKIS